MEYGRRVLQLAIAAVASVTASVLYSDPPKGDSRSSSDTHSPLEQIIRLKDKNPVFVETLCNLGQGTAIPQEASSAFQALPGHDMLLRLGVLEPQLDHSLKLSRSLRIDIIGWDFLLPANPASISLIFPNNTSYDTFTLFAWNAHLYPDSDIAPGGTNALQKRSFPSPWILATRKNPHQLIIDASPWMLLAFTRERNSERLSVVIGLHPPQEISPETLNALRSAESPNWEAIQKVYTPSFPSGANASSHPEIANRISIFTQVFTLLAHKDEWKLVQAPVLSDHDTPIISLSPDSQVSLSSKTLDP
ncbi:MAG: hypothetical protein LBD40_03200, partial [Puniceicoccales bacterium]|nr:hypothetical protein [Puniceicoccales bacterium]